MDSSVLSPGSLWWQYFVGGIVSIISSNKNAGIMLLIRVFPTMRMLATLQFATNLSDPLNVIVESPKKPSIPTGGYDSLIKKAF